MKYKLLSLIVLVTMLFSCDGMYDTLDDYSGEIVYPAKFDTIVGHIGLERVEIDILKAGRIPASQIRLGKAKKTVVEYDGKVLILDTLASWVPINDLTESKLYRFKIYTIDEFENKSVSQGIALIPYNTAADLNQLAMTTPRVMTSPASAVVDWNDALTTSIFWKYLSMKYNYVDKDGVKKEGEVKEGEVPRFFVSNLEAGKSFTVNIDYRIIPKVDNKVILDTVVVTRPVVITMPLGSTEFSVEEKAILTANGVTTFTPDAVAGVTKLVYPMHANSLQDIFYFSGLKELDLTGGTIFTLPTLDYDKNNIKNTVGGGEWIPFMKKVDNVSTAKMLALKDLLESKILTKVRYVPHSMGLDDLLAPYVASGVVELVSLPASAVVPKRLILDGGLQDGNWKLEVVHPATDAPAGGLAGEIYKVTLKAKNATFVIALPREYAFNFEEYKHLEMDVYTPSKDALSGDYTPYKRLWFRVMNNLWAFGGNSDYGQEIWDHSRDKYPIGDADLAKWTSVKVDLSPGIGKHNRVLAINIGGEPSLDFKPAADMVYYFSNLRFSK